MGGLLATFSVFGLFTAAVVALLLGIVLVVHGSRAKHRLSLVAGWILAVPSLCITGLLFAAWLLLGIGPVYSQDAWPQDLTALVEVAQAGPANVDVSCLWRFLDTEHVWCLALPPERLAHVAERVRLAHAVAADVPPSFWCVFPRWWRPAQREGNLFLATPKFPGASRGPDDQHYFAMYDERAERLYVWSKFNF